MARSKISLGLSLLLACGTACRSEEPAEATAKPRQSDKVVFQRPVEKKPIPIADKSGALLPSGSKIRWFELPKGFVHNADGRRHLLTGQGVTLEQVQDYVAARVLAKRFDRMARGGAYVEARSPEDPKREPLDIMISSGLARGEVFVRINEYMEPAAQPLSLDQVRSALVQDQKHAE